MSKPVAYAPFLDSLHLAHKKRHIHKLTVTTGSGNPRYGLFLQVRITPHRSRDFSLDLIFTASNFIKVKVSTYTNGETTRQGALGDAMLLIAEIVAAWTTIAEETDGKS